MGGAKIWVKESWLRFSSDNFLQPVQPTTCQPSKVISKEIWFTKSEKNGLQNQRNMVYKIREIWFTDIQRSVMVVK